MALATLLRVPLSVLALAAGASAGATSLSGAMTADNAFVLYISTDDSVLGTALLSGSNWGSTYTLAATALGTAPVYYLHAVATDFGAPASFIGSFSLDDSGAWFANGTQTLVSNASDWTVRISGYGDSAQAPVSLGLNGVSPWGQRPGISATAEQIWSADRCGSCTRYFSTTITTAVPEPGSALLLGLGLPALLLAARRRALLKA